MKVYKIYIAYPEIRLKHLASKIFEEMWVPTNLVNSS